ncbi:MAG TPA: hypothetical protein VKG64_06155 [Methylomirabilota bacterium]|nr:hypothetical protein [Methylomirabilota bacterium]
MIRSRHTVLCALLVWGFLIAPPAARAQQAGKVPRVGVLWGGPAAFAQAYVEARSMPHGAPPRRSPSSWWPPAIR